METVMSFGYSKELRARLEEATKVVQMVEQAIRKEIIASPEYKVASSMTAKPFQIIIDQYGHARADITLNAVFPTKEAKPRVFIEPSVANSLLNSKLLTDEEKRRVMFAVSGGIVGASE